LFCVCSSGAPLVWLKPMEVIIFFVVESRSRFFPALELNSGAAAALDSMGLSDWEAFSHSDTVRDSEADGALASRFLSTTGVDDRVEFWAMAVRAGGGGEAGARDDEARVSVRVVGAAGDGGLDLAIAAAFFKPATELGFGAGGEAAFVVELDDVAFGAEALLDRAEGDFLVTEDPNPFALGAGAVLARFDGAAEEAGGLAFVVLSR